MTFTNYSVFFSVVMQDHKHDYFIDEIINEIERKHGKVFCGLRLWSDENQYPPYDEAFQIVLESLQKSSLYVLYYPERVVSGALVELGMAVAMKKPVLIYTKSVENMTYFMRGYQDLITDHNLIMPWIDEYMTL